MNHRRFLSHFYLSLLLASFATASFAANKPVIAKNKAATAKLVKQSTAKVTKAAKPAKSLKAAIENWGPGAIQGQYVKRANFRQETATLEARQLADWVVDSGDNQNMPFVIIDKKNAKVFVFHPHGGLRGAAPVLLGLTVGDYTAPGLADKPLSAVTVDERTTPAGRFLAAADKNIKGVDIIWIDYDSSLSLHPLVKGTEAERRAERIASALVSDRRISYGCVNAPVNFFSSVILPSFKKTDGIVYILPEVQSKQQVFAAYYDVDEHEKLVASGQVDPIAKFASKVKPTLATQEKLPPRAAKASGL